MIIQVPKKQQDRTQDLVAVVSGSVATGVGGKPIKGINGNI